MTENAEFTIKFKSPEGPAKTCICCSHRSVCKYVDNVARFEKHLQSLIDSHTEDIHYLRILIDCQYKMSISITD